MLYPIPYLILITLYGILALMVHQRKDDKGFCQYANIAGILIYIIFFGFRGFVMHDWMDYYPAFEKLEFYDLITFELGESREIGWIAFQLLCKSIYDNYHFMIFVHSLLCVFLLYKFFKRYTHNIMLGFIIYFAFDGMVLSINLLRNVLAILIFINAIPYLIDRKPLPYFMMCLAAFAFHYSSIIFFPLYFFLHKKTNKWVYAGVCCIMLALYFSNVSIFLKLISALGIGGDLLQNKIESYADISSHLHISVGLLERLLTIILFFCYYDKLQNMRKENRVFINAFLIFLSSAFLISEFSEISKRLCILFEFCYWILWIDLIKCFYYANNRKLYMSFIALYCSIKIAMPIVNQPVCEYDNLLLGGIKSYYERKAIFEKTFELPD